MKIARFLLCWRLTFEMWGEGVAKFAKTKIYIERVLFLACFSVIHLALSFVNIIVYILKFGLLFEFIVYRTHATRNTYDFFVFYLCFKYAFEYDLGKQSIWIFFSDQKICSIKWKRQFKSITKDDVKPFKLDICKSYSFIMVAVWESKRAARDFYRFKSTRWMNLVILNLKIKSK